MRKINKIKIGGIYFDVTEEKDLKDPTAGRGLDGDIAYGKCKIRINANLSYQLRMQTLWHEIIHGILAQSGVEKYNEILVDVLAFGILMVLVDNPELANVRPEQE